MKRKSVLILFPLEHIAFSPTTLGIYDALAELFDVTIYCPKPRAGKIINIGFRDIQYFNFTTHKKGK